MVEEYDMVVVGTGWFGLAAARTYIELHPTENILVLEAAGSCGGTWSEDRLYPGLKSNNLIDNYEYPEFSMSEEKYGVKKGNHIPGTVLHQYLTDFAKKYGGFSRTRFNTKVDSVEPGKTDGWILTTIGEKGQLKLSTRKLILATGLTSQPNFPQYEGKESFNAPYFHAKDFCRNGDTTKTDQNAVIVGGAKSAYDVAFAYVQAGAHVDLVVWPNGNGPVWISDPYVMGGLRLEKLLNVRILTWFSPCPFGDSDGFSVPQKFLHGTRIGRWLVDRFWGMLSSGVIDANGYLKHPEVQKLQPWSSVFWIGSGLSIHNYTESFWDMIKDSRINVYVADVDHLSDKTVHLTTGGSLPANVLVCSTGWKKEPSIKFYNFGTAGIGLPQPENEQLRLSQQADTEILHRFPRLQQQPTLRYTPKTANPYRLYRFMIPPTQIQTRTIALAGAVSSVATSVTATVQALWISAFLDNKLSNAPPDLTQITQEVMLHTQ
ncbi:putative flavin-binding monooxygenase-like family protein [Phaeomoniella chlamydospora]|uniref:Putative flavin-binding monooxygenase-like family protein n=1 Tax=Phaeomoniella chlamydospora TaxID=158046 RepID=A0A0G2EWD1_PHACM|nr:putative flavin-binding monooxygenase-like family protein [Phaeomoniella chlamydospora]